NIRKLVHIDGLRRLKVDHQHLLAHRKDARLVERVGKKCAGTAMEGEHDLANGAWRDGPSDPSDLAGEAPIDLSMHLTPHLTPSPAETSQQWAGWAVLAVGWLRSPSMRKPGTAGSCR